MRGGWSALAVADSRSMFWDGNSSKALAIDGGEPAVLCTLPDVDPGNHSGTRFPFVGAAFSPDGERIVFSSWLRLWEIRLEEANRSAVRARGARRFLLRPEFYPIAADRAS